MPKTAIVASVIATAEREPSGERNARISAARDENRPGQLAEPRALTAVRVEVRRVEPRAERAVERRPLAIDARIPRSVAVVAFRHAGLAEDAFVREPETLRGGARRGVQRVALPLVAAVVE